MSISSGTGVSGIQTQLIQNLGGHIHQDQLDAWFRDLRIDHPEAQRVVVTAKSGFVRDWLRRNFLPQIEQAARQVTGRPDCVVVLNHDGSNDAVRSSSNVDANARPTGSPTGNGEVSGMTRVGAPPVEGAQHGSSSEGRAQAGGDPAGEPARGGEARGNQDFASGGSTFGGGSQFGSGSDFGGGHGRRAEGDTGFGDLNNDYTFDQFVVGTCNRLCHAAAIAVGDNPGRAYNPLFVHGNVGLGKTHILQATCHAIRQKRERARVLYMSCEDFTNRFIESIQRGQLEEFRNFHRSVDVLVIDDIQFLANKEKTQDEFFHTFNALYNTNRQIILSSDRSPADIPTIEDRLVSRFKWGLVAEMEVPEFETRVAIVQRKALMRQVVVPDDVAYFIAERIDTNIRELEGAIIKVIGIASITERDLDVALAEEALRGVAINKSRAITVPDIMDVVTSEFAISARELTGKGRTQAVSLPRQICMYLCRELTEQSLDEIGKYFGNRDHTTVLYSVQKIKKRVDEDRVFRDLVASLANRIQS